MHHKKKTTQKPSLHWSKCKKSFSVGAQRAVRHIIFRAIDTGP